MTQEFVKVPALPIRTATGKWKQVTKRVKVEKAEMPERKQEPEAPVAPVNAQKPEPLVPVLNVDEVKEQIGLLAVDVTENTQENLKNVREILKFADATTFSAKQREESFAIQSTALITLLAIFKDILPNYAIRPLTEEEKSVCVSKVVKAQRNFDENLLNVYRLFVQRLEEILKTSKKGDAQLLPIAVACLGELVLFAGHFNFSDRINVGLVSQIFVSEPIAELAIKAIGRAFGEDPNGKTTTHLTRLLSDSLHTRGYLNVTSPVIEVFLSIRSRNLYASKAHGPAITTTYDIAKSEAYRRKKGHLSKSEKKDLRLKLEESSKTAAAEAEYSMQERQKWSTNTLKFVFRVLFGILKAVEAEDGEGGKSMITLLPAVLKCLARFSSYLSIEFYADLLVSLNRIIVNNTVQAKGFVTVARLPFTSIIYLIQTVLQINMLQESAPSIKGIPTVDLKFYYDLLYREMLRIIKDPECLEQWRSLESSLEHIMVLLFLSKRHVPAERVAAFSHRLLFLLDALSAHPEASKYLVRLLLRLLERHERARGILDADGGGLGIGGAYQPDCPDPDFCSPFAKQLDIAAFLAKNKKLSNDCRQVLRNIQRLAEQ